MIKQPKDVELRERLFIIDILRELKNVYTYRQLSSLFNIQESLLCRYVNGITIPSEIQYNNIINKIKNKEFLTNFIKERIRIYNDGFIDTSFLLFYPNILKILIEINLSKIPKMENITKVFGIASNGIPFATLVADTINKPLVIAKKHKDSINMEYYEENIKESEGVINSLYLRKDLVNKNDKIIIVDDVIKTGKTIMASYNLLKKSGSNILLILAIVSKEDALRKLINITNINALFTI
jgi:adenine/guanine phosphoribosyltransferase-like PRPP-binding protein